MTGKSGVWKSPDRGVNTPKLEDPMESTPQQPWEGWEQRREGAGAAASSRCSRPGGDAEPAPAKPTHGTPDPLFPLVTHGKKTCFAAALGTSSDPASVPRFAVFFKGSLVRKHLGPRPSCGARSPEGIFLPGSAGLVCKPRSVWEAAWSCSQR